MNISEKYKQLINEQITKYQFVESARKDPSLKQWINSFMSFDNIIDVLKNKNIIVEVKQTPSKSPKTLLKEIVEDDPFGDKFNPDKIDDEFPEQGDPDLSIPWGDNGENDYDSKEDDEEDDTIEDKDTYDEFAIGDEVTYSGDNEELQGIKNIIISRIYKDKETDEVWFDVENIEDGEAILKVSPEGFDKTEFDLSETGLFGKKKQTPPPEKEEGVEYRPKLDKKINKNNKKNTYPSVGKVKIKPSQNEIKENLSLDQMRDIAKNLKLKGLGNEEIIDKIIAMRQGKEIDDEYNNNLTQDSEEVQTTINKLTQHLKKQRKSDSEIQNIIKRIRSGDKETLLHHFPRRSDSGSNAELRRDVVTNLYIDNMMKEDQNHVNWDEISEEDAYSLFDYQERTGRLPYGLTPEKYNEIIAKYNISSDDDSLNESKKEKKSKLGIDDVNPTELRLGIKYEMEENEECDWDKACQIALKKLNVNPIHYTYLKLSGGVENKKEATIKKPNTDEVEVKNGNLTDKKNAEKPVKGYPNAKANANKQSKETVKPIKNIQQLTHKAQKAKGIKDVMDMPGKEKIIKESLKDMIKRMILEEAKAWGGWKIIKEKKSKFTNPSPEIISEDHLDSMEDQIQYILQHKDIFKQKDTITPEYLQGLNNHHIRKIYQAVEAKLKDNQQLGDQDPEYHELKENHDSCSCGCNSCGDKKN